MDLQPSPPPRRPQPPAPDRSPQRAEQPAWVVQLALAPLRDANSLIEGRESPAPRTRRVVLAHVGERRVLHACRAFLVVRLGTPFADETSARGELLHRQQRADALLNHAFARRSSAA